ncbi:sulfotransferase domain-containing protein [Alteribacillus bidgolensis]|uniref:Sulfotransferase domain-containing protein n=1 Tax=Alteribacillus bidgolensis TaxID=930129 RepID=A0A1G8PP37_9BACI|nr:sulfotransferase domain-containing protein [Alteribacillus bidgolensis]SDI94247.1 Sulfotransferase domain-containing protein [Alteribacillus bidgolensis]
MFNKIISIHGVPRSGTSWLGQIFNSLLNTRYKFQPLFSYAFKDAINIRSSKSEIMGYYEKLYSTNDEFLDQTKQIEKGYYPQFNKLNSPDTLVTKMVRYHYLIPKLLEEVENIKIIAIVRNPFEVLSSWKNAPKELPPELDFEEEWRYAQNRNLFKPEEYFGYEKWKEATKLYLWAKEKYPDKVLIIKYEDLVSNTEALTKKMFDFCNLEIDDQTLEFINVSKSKKDDDPYSVYKKDIDLDKGQKQLPKCIVDTIYQELNDTEFKQFL